MKAKTRNDESFPLLMKSNTQYMASRYVCRYRIAVMNVVTFHPMICSVTLKLFSLFITRMTCFGSMLYYILTNSLCLNLYYWQYKIPNILLCITIFRMSLYCPTTGIIPLVLSRVHNIRSRGEYPTSLVWPNALRKVMT